MTERAGPWSLVVVAPAAVLADSLANGLAAAGACALVAVISLLSTQRRAAPLVAAVAAVAAITALATLLAVGGILPELRPGALYPALLLLLPGVAGDARAAELLPLALVPPLVGGLRELLEASGIGLASQEPLTGILLVTVIAALLAWRGGRDR